MDIQRANLRTMLKVRQAQSGEDKATEGYRQHQPRHAFDDRAPRHDTMASMAESILESDEPCGFSHLLLHQCLEHLALRKSGVKQMGMNAAYLITAVCLLFSVPVSPKRAFQSSLRKQPKTHQPSPPLYPLS